MTCSYALSRAGSPRVNATFVSRPGAAKGMESTVVGLVRELLYLDTICRRAQNSIKTQQYDNRGRTSAEKLNLRVQ